MVHAQELYNFDTMVTKLEFEYLSIEYKPGNSFKPELLSTPS